LIVLATFDPYVGAEQDNAVEPEVAPDAGVTSFEDGGRIQQRVAIVVFFGILLASFWA
jgi:hypothetical protein